MNEFVIPSLYLLAGIMVYAMFHHFSIALHLPRDPVQMLFGGICMLTVPFAIFHAQMLQATNVVEFVSSLKWNLSAVLLLLPLLMWFIALYTGKRPSFFLWVMSVLFAVLFVVNLTQPFSLQYSLLEGIHIHQLPWGENVTRGDGHHGIWVYSTIACVITVFVYALYALICKYRASRQLTDLSMLIAIWLFLLLSTLGILTRLSVINFVEPGPVGILIMVIVMSMALTNGTQRRLLESELRFRTIIEQSPIGMAFGRDGITVEVNQVYMQMFGYDDMTEVIGQPLLNQIAPQCRPEMEDRITRRIKGELVDTSYETIGLRKDGTQFPIYISAKRIVLNEGPLTFGFLIDMTELKRAEEELLESQIKLRELSGHLEDVREAERTRIAREIHDELGQLLTVARIDLTRIMSMLNEPTDKIEEKLKKLISIVERTADAARTISENLRPGMLDVLGLEAALEHHIARFSEATNISCSFELNLGEIVVDSKVATVVFRIVQEALTNVARHSHAKSVNIQLVDLDSEILVIIQDDGCGMPKVRVGTSRSTYGLLGMSERITLLGGTLQIESAPGSGTRIEASIPTKTNKRLGHD